MSLDGRSGPVVSRLKLTAERTASVLRRKAISSEIATYIVNSVFIPALLHQGAVTSISNADIDSIQRSWLTLVKRRASLPASTNNDLIWSSNGYCVGHLGDAFANAHLADLFCQLYDTGILGQATRVVTEKVRKHIHLDCLPFSAPCRKRAHGESTWNHFFQREVRVEGVNLLGFTEKILRQQTAMFRRVNLANA